MCLRQKCRHFGVAQQRHVPIGTTHPTREALPLNLTCLFDASTDLGAGFAQTLIRQLAACLAKGDGSSRTDGIVFHAWHFHLDVYPVQQRAGAMS